VVGQHRKRHAAALFRQQVEPQRGLEVIPQARSTPTRLLPVGLSQQTAFLEVAELGVQRVRLTEAGLVGRGDHGGSRMHRD
jgi:hypothetical protein